jgi:hypothetical protein
VDGGLITFLFSSLKPLEINKANKHQDEKDFINPSYSGIVEVVSHVN